MVFVVVVVVVVVVVAVDLFFVCFAPSFCPITWSKMNAS